MRYAERNYLSLDSTCSFLEGETDPLPSITLQSPLADMKKLVCVSSLSFFS